MRRSEIRSFIHRHVSLLQTKVIINCAYFSLFKISKVGSEKCKRLISIDTTRTAQKMTPQKMCRCRENVFIEFLPSNDKKIHRQI
jgi:hypothetical protein